MKSGALGERLEAALRGDLVAERRLGGAGVVRRPVRRARRDDNRIKEPLRLFSERPSTAYLRHKQTRWYFSAVAYRLMRALRRLGLGAELAKAQGATLRLKRLKVGALLQITVRKVWVPLASGYPSF